MKKVSQNYLSSSWCKDGSSSLCPWLVIHSSEDPEQQEEIQDPLPLQFHVYVPMYHCALHVLRTYCSSKGFKLGRHLYPFPDHTAQFHMHKCFDIL